MLGGILPAARVAAYLIPALLWALLYARHIGALGLYSDDWMHLSMAATMSWSQLARTWPLDYRPFDILPWLAGYAALRQTIAEYYIALFAVQLASAYLLCALVRRLCGSALLGVAVASIWICYPADQSVFWLSAAHYRLGTCFLLLGLVLLTGPMKERRTCYAGAVLCCALCLACDELFLGLLLGLPVVAAWAAPGEPGSARRLARAAPFVALLAAYLAYRVWIGPHLLDLPDAKGGGVSLSAATAAQVEGRGAVTVLLQAWQEAVRSPGPGSFAAYRPSAYAARALITASPTSPGGVGPLSWDLGEIYVLALALIGAAALLRRRHVRIWAAIRPGVIAVGVGALGVAGGFLSIAVTTAEPTLNGIASRVDAASVLGAACLVVGVAWVLAHWLPLPRAVGRLLFLCAVVPLGVVGAARSERTATTYEVGWRSQQQLWRALLTVAPSLRPHTFVVLAAADEPGGEAIAALRPWGASSALGLLYPGQDVAGDILPPAAERQLCAATRGADQDGTMIHLTPDGLLPHGSDAPVPYGRLLVVRFAGDGGGRAWLMRGRAPIAGGRCVLPSHSDRVLPGPDLRTATWRAVATAGG